MTLLSRPSPDLIPSARRGWHRARTLLATTTLAALLVACGGNVSRVAPFVPTRFVSFGDELSVLTATGTKYSINALTADTTDAAGTLDCHLLPIWNQSLASTFGFAFTGCQPTTGTAVAATLAAQLNARVADVQAQVAAYRTAQGFDSHTLVTVMAGSHDLLDAYQTLYVGGGRSDSAKNAALAAANAAGVALGNLVNQIADEGAGGRVVWATPPNLGYSPFAIAEEAATPGSQQVIKDLFTAFNKAYRLEVINDGRYVGLVAADEIIVGMMNKDANVASAVYGVTNQKTAGCTTALPDCTPLTLTDTSGTTAGNPTIHVWADNLHPGSNWQVRAGTLARSRALNNPF